MKNSNIVGRSGSERVELGRHRALLLASAAIAVAGFVAPTALAQEEAAEDEARQETVVVTGMRASVQAAQEIKKNADGVVDSIVAEDIGKLPDNNVAESLARVTGVQIRRDSGEGNSVLIRGLPNVVTLFNGRELYTTTSRFVNLADVPSNILAGVDIYKSNQANMVEGGIAGTIDVRTRRAFDNPGFNLDGNVRAAYNDKAESINPNLGMTVSNTWETGNGDFGALLGLSFTSSDYHEERAFNIESVDQSGQFNATNPAPSTPFLGPFVMGYIPISGTRERPSANLALDWRISDDTEIYFDGFASQYKNDFSLDFFVGLPFLGNGDISGTVFPGTNVMHTLTNHDVFTITSTQANDQESLTQQYAIGGRHRIEDFELSTELSMTDSDFTYENPIVDVGVVVPVVNVSTNVDGTAQLDYGGPGFDIRSGDGFSLANFFDNHGHLFGGSVDWRGDVKWSPADAGVISEVTGGLRVSHRRAKSLTSFVGGTGGPVTPTLANDLTGFGCVSEEMADGGPNYVMTSWFTPCSDYLLNQTGTLRELFTGTSAARGIDPGSLFRDKELTQAAYIQGKFYLNLGEMPLQVVAGARYVITNQDLEGNLSQETDATNPGLEYTPIVRSNKSNDLLPNISAKLNITDDVIARFAAGRTITRPNFADLNPGVSLSTVVSNTTGLTGNGGNPNLEPVKSNNFDATLEYYFAADGYVAATAFYREFEGYVQPSVGFENFDGLDYRVTRPGNTGDGNLSGFEVSYQQFYDQLPGALSGLGVQANITYMDGDTTNLDTGVSQSITGLSNLSANLVGLYELGPFSARLAYNWRDEFLDVRNIAAGYDLYVDTTSQLDGQFSYELNDRVTLTLEGNNLLDTHFKDFFEDPNSPELNGLFPRDTRRYDRTIIVGARFKY